MYHLCNLDIRRFKELPCSYHVQKLRVGEVVILEQQEDLPVLGGGRLHGGLQLALELLGAKVLAHLQRDQLGLVQGRNNGDRGSTADP